jgi:hypothetical protein
LDIRGDLGYVLVPPSYVVDPDYAGSYVWSVDSASTFAPMPEWLVETTTRREPKPEGYFSDIANGVPDGCRNVSLASLCGKLLQVGLTPRQTFEYLIFWNQRNSPPLDEGRIKTAVMNIARRNNGKLK